MASTFGIGTPPKLLVFDIDGTLMHRERLSRRTAALLDRLDEANILWTVATGRGAGPARRVLRHLAGRGRLPWIIAGGAVTVRGRDGTLERISARPIEPEVIDEAVTALRHVLPDAVVGADRHTEIVYETWWPEWHSQRERRRLRPGETLAEVPCDMLRIWHPAVASVLRGGLPGVELYHVGRPGYAEVTAGGVSKAEAVADLAASVGVDAEQTWAFGDTGNDISILEWAGVGIAMRDAHPEAVAAADAMTRYGAAEDGVAAALESLVQHMPSQRVLSGETVIGVDHEHIGP